jgi:hypothetical protein
LSSSTVRLAQTARPAANDRVKGIRWFIASSKDHLEFMAWHDEKARRCGPETLLRRTGWNLLRTAITGCPGRPTSPPPPPGPGHWEAGAGSA